MVVQQAGDDRLAAAGATADLVGGLEHGDLHAFGGQGEAAASPLGPPPTTTAVLMPALRARVPASLRAAGSVPGSDQLTWVGMGPLGSHGCSATASATFQVPRSMTPSAASISW